ncbi:MAG: M28 family peptidase [Phycisphaerae bacterium]|nr:M28 family peptidase [Phycisphaerae bacterium]
MPAHSPPFLCRSRARRFRVLLLAGAPLSIVVGLAAAWTAAQDQKTAEQTTPIVEISPQPRIHEVLRTVPDDVRTFNEYLTILASPWMDGRLPGTKGMDLAMDFVEWSFKKAGLEAPAQSADGTPSFRQQFPLGGKTTFSEQAFTLTAPGISKEFVLGTDYDFSTLGDGGDVSGDAVFVGYAIQNPDRGYMTFNDEVDLTGKIAVMLRFEPMTEEGKSRWSEEGWSRSAGFQGKFAALLARHPAAIIIVNTPGADDPRVQSLKVSGGSMAKMPVALMTPEAADALVQAADESGRSLMELRTLADAEGTIIALPRAKLRLALRAESKPVMAENVVGLLPGRGALKDEVIVMGGHLDHLGYGDFGSRGGAGALHPGADDNASGSAGIMMLADMLKKEYEKLPADQPLRSILFIAFSAEESGLNGSRFYAQNPLFPIGQHVLMFNYDMIGRLVNDRLAVSGTASGKDMHEWALQIYDSAKATYGLEVVGTKAAGGGSDHASFLAVGVPALFGILADFGEQRDYHTPRDVGDLINREGAVKAIWLFRDMALSAAQRSERFAFDTEAGPMRGPGMRVRLGVRSRASDDGSGVDIIEVTEGGVAEAAGFKVGDKMLKWNKEPVKTRQEFVDLLRQHEPGDEVQAVIDRDGEEQTLFVKFPKSE